MFSEFIEMLDDARDKLGDNVVLNLEVNDVSVRLRATWRLEDELIEYQIGVTKKTLANNKTNKRIMSQLTTYLLRKKQLHTGTTTYKLFSKDGKGAGDDRRK